MARILVVDDEEGVRDLLETVLKRKGHEVLTADGGLKAAEMLKRERPHIMILHLSPPDLHGLEVLRRIRENELPVRVIVLTGERNRELERSARDLGVTAFVQKTFSLDLLGQGLRAALDEIQFDGAPGVDPRPSRDAWSYEQEVSKSNEC